MPTIVDCFPSFVLRQDRVQILKSQKSKMQARKYKVGQEIYAIDFTLLRNKKCTQFKLATIWSQLFLLINTYVSILLLFNLSTA